MSYIPPPEFGPFIKHFIEANHTSKYAIAAATHITRNTLDRWERGAKWIQYGTLEIFADHFGLSLDDFFKQFEAYQQSIVTDTAQTTTDPPRNDEAVTLMPGGPPAPTVPYRTRWKLISTVALCLFIVASVFATYALLVYPRIQGNSKPMIVLGKVVCANNEPVVGIWADTFQGITVDKSISGYADKRAINSNGSEATFAYTLKGNAYNLHVGCGGSIQHWKDKDYTETGSGPVHDHNSHSFVCYEVSPAIDYGSCYLQY